jgi:glycosyltransferase involved in cell wall biosynthesis
MRSISVVFPTFNEPLEAIETVKSIRATAGTAVEIVCVDDGDDPPPFANEHGVKYHKTQRRIGSGPARHLAAMLATGTHIVQCDTHVRFAGGWYEALTLHCFDRPHTVHCAKMLALESGAMEFSQHKGAYHGATWCFSGVEGNKPKIFESVWKPMEQGDDYELPAVMGSTYCYPRDFYLKLSPHRFLRSFGQEEESLSLKTWLAGGDCRILKDFVIGHKFRTKRERVPYDIPTQSIIYNKIFLIMTCLPTRYQEKLIARFPQNTDLRAATALIRNDSHLIEIEREHNEQIFVRSFDWLLQKFGLSC